MNAIARKRGSQNEQALLRPGKSAVQKDRHQSLSTLTPASLPSSKKDFAGGP
jgi:hypothetical protein